MDKEAKIYLAGHTGLVGSALHRTLANEGHTNIITRTFEELDLRRQINVEHFFAQERPEYVFIAAAKVGGILANSTYPAEFIYDNLMIASNIIHAAYRFGVKKLLNLGSSCIYPKAAPQPLSEDSLLTGLLEPTNEAYAIAKIAAIKLCRYYNEQYGTHFISLMPTNLFGPHDNFNLETAHVLPALIRKFHLARLLQERDFPSINRDLQTFPIGFGKAVDHALDEYELIKLLAGLGITSSAVKLWGSGRALREFLYVDDVASAALFFMNQLSSELATSRECFNVGTGTDIAIADVAVLIREITGFRGTIEFDVNALDGMPCKRLDMSNTHKLGWHHTTSLANGLKKSHRWYVGQQEQPQETGACRAFTA